MVTRTLLAILTSASLLSADTLLLRNGSRIEGNFVSGDNRLVRFAVGAQINSYDIGDIDTIHFAGAGPAASQNQGYAPSPPAPQPMDPSAQNQPPDGYGPPPPGPGMPPTNTPGGLQVPAGTQVVVRLIDPVNSEKDSLGQTFRASVDQPVFVNGQTVIPRGADAILTLIDAQKSGKIQGRTVLTLDLKSVTVNGRPYDIVSTGVAQSSEARGKRSGEVIGGTAALGAIIGAIAGGGKGAAIGAGSGAAVGTAGQVLTSGQKVNVPAETRLTFTLQNPVTF
ncbi:MAG: hypothetical protein M3Y24_04115 [Acidobacteriota bacterium]|nr:hypothetical protein [Acidobacteriota bacterium]